MKHIKPMLFSAAVMWLVLLMTEKMFSVTSAFKNRNSSVVLKLGYSAARLFRSIILFCLAVFNLIMAIALIEDKK